MATRGSDSEIAIEVQGLRKSFGDVQALCGTDLRAPAGSVLGLLGPNGAGKTTAVRILATLLRPDGGSARVAGSRWSPTRPRCGPGSGSPASTRRSTRT